MLGTGMEQHKSHLWEGRRAERELSEGPEQLSLPSVQPVTAEHGLALLLHCPSAPDRAFPEQLLAQPQL